MNQQTGRGSGGPEQAVLAPPAFLDQARRSYGSGDWVHAEHLCRLALAARPDFFDPLNLLGIIAARSGRLEEAASLFGRAVAVDPDNAFAHNNRGNTFKDLGRLEEALGSFERALEINPNYAEAYSNRGNALKDLGRFGHALASYDRALRIKPDNAVTHNNRGMVLQDLNRLEDALDSFDRALKIQPDYVDAHVNRGIALQDLKRIDPALACYESALRINPEHAVAHWNLARCRLLAGDFARGWQGFEWRWKMARPGTAGRGFSQPVWLGKESLADKTILLYAEQGLGDTLQFCRYARTVANLGARIIMEVPGPLVSLLSTLDGVAHVVPQGASLPRFDYQCPLMSLPLAFRTELSSIPAPNDYLNSDPAKRLYWQEKLVEKDKRRVGLVWSGGSRPDQPELWSLNERRNIDLAKLARLKDERIAFYSLQKGQPAQSDPARLQAAGWDGPEIIDHTAELNDFSDTAALVDNLDLVIAVDTSTAHLAGALGKPVWILNRYDTCWRWLLGRDDSPWYPSVRLYRQERPGDWDGVVERVAADLSAAFRSTR
jgi:tetratricopeptide (TPR) repeat protein